MKTLITYYSRTGNTETIAKILSKKLKADLEELKDLKNRKGLKGWITGGKDAFKKKLTKIEKLKKDPSKYDLVILGSPVWAGTIAPANRTFIEENKNKIKQVAFFCTMGGKDEQKAFIHMKELIEKEPLATLALRTKEIKKEGYKEKIEIFTKIVK